MFRQQKWWPSWKNGSHFDFSGGQRFFPYKWPKRDVHANFGACITIWKIPLIYSLICPTNSHYRLFQHHYTPEYTETEPLIYKALMEMDIQDPTSKLGFLWKISLPLCFPRPAWSGIMQMVHKRNYPGLSSVKYFANHWYVMYPHLFNNAMCMFTSQDICTIS